MTWHRTGPVEVDSGEISGMDAPNPDDEILSPDFTAYYANDGRLRVCMTYYVVRHPADVEAGETEEDTYYYIEEVFHSWVVDDAGEPITDPREEVPIRIRYSAYLPVGIHRYGARSRVCRIGRIVATHVGG